MTDKQIIDGVDVSGCKHYKNRTCIADYCLTDMPFGEAKCELNPNCHYEQLKAKEQECEELKDKLNCCFCNPYVELNDTEKQRKCVEVTECFRRQLDQLKAENEELKNTLEEIQRIANSGQRSSNLFVRSLSETIFATASEVLDV